MDKPDQARRTFARGLLAGSAYTLAACGRKKDSNADLPELSAAQAEKLYGKAPEPGGDIAYQPAVKIVGDGAKSIRAFNADGVSWMLDAGARGVENLRKGDLMMVTGRCAGRVIATRREGDFVRVVVGPAELTDFIRECHVEVSQSLDLGQTTPLVAPRLAGIDMRIDPAKPYRAQTPDEALGSVEDLLAANSHGGDAMMRRALFDPEAAARAGFGLRRTALGGDSPIIESSIRSDGVELAVKIQNEFMAMKFVAGLRFKAPRLDYLLDVDPPGIVNDAYLGLSGGAGLRIGFIAASGPEGDVTQNVSQPGALVPVDYVLAALGNLGIFSAAFQQRFLIKSALSARSSVLRAIGDYELNGSLGFRLRHGNFSTTGPKLETVNNSMLDSAGGYSVGANGMVITHQLRLIVGLGAGGFIFGPYIALSTAAGVTRGSDLATVPGLTGMRAPACERVELFMDAKPGLGWQLPKFFTGIVNLFLEPFGGHVEGSGGWEGPQLRLISERAWAPDYEMCRLDDYDSDTTAPNSGSTGGGGPPLPNPEPEPPDLPRDITPDEPAPGTGEAAVPGDPGQIDPDVVCPDPEARRRFGELGVDIATLCKNAARTI